MPHHAEEGVRAGGAARGGPGHQGRVPRRAEHAVSPGHARAPPEEVRAGGRAEVPLGGARLPGGGAREGNSIETKIFMCSYLKIYLPGVS